MFKNKRIRLRPLDYIRNGTKHYWARVRATGEVAEISHEVMRYLRAEEKRIYREFMAINEHGSYAFSRRSAR
jgi:hypothetical protein